MLEDSELPVVVLNVLDNGCRFGKALGEEEGCCCCWVGCSGIRVSEEDVFEVKEGMKKRFVGRLVVLLLAEEAAMVVEEVFVFGLTTVEFLLDTRRCSLAERGMTTVEADKPNLEKRGVTSYVLVVYQELLT